MTTPRLRNRALIGLAGATVLVAVTGCGGVKTGTVGGGNDGSGYPNKTIEMTVGASAGGSSDLISRAMSQGMSKTLGVAMPVVNKPGANGALVAKELATKAPDGYNISIQNASLFTITPLAVAAGEATAIADFDIVQGVSRDDYVMVTNPQSGYRSIDDLKAAGKNIKYGTTGVGTGAQLASAMTFAAAKIDATAVPFDGGAPNLTAVLGNQVNASTLQIGEAIENITSGKLVPLAVFSSDRVDYLPDVPTAKEQGYDVEVSQYRFMTTPKGASDEVKAKLSEAMQATFATEEYRKFNADNSLTPMEISGEQVEAQLRADAERYRSTTKRLGIDLTNG